MAKQNSPNTVTFSLYEPERKTSLNAPSLPPSQSVREKVLELTAENTANEYAIEGNHPVISGFLECATNADKAKYINEVGRAKFGELLNALNAEKYDEEYRFIVAFVAATVDYERLSPEQGNLIQSESGSDFWRAQDLASLRESIARFRKSLGV